MTSVAVFGALHHDVVVDAPRLPRIDETLTGSAVDYRSGGKGGNQAIAAASMGAPTAMIGRIGQDATGETVLVSLSEAGVDCSELRRCASPTGMSVAITLPDGDYGAVIVSGANLMNDGVVHWKTEPIVAIIQNEVPEDANARFVRDLHQDCRLIWNAAPARTLHREIASRTDFLIVNRLEAADLTGSENAVVSAQSLQSRVRGEVIVTLGGEGLVLTRDDGYLEVPAPKSDVVSTHGAGDMFVGAFAARLAHGDGVEAAVAFAQTAASLLVGSTMEERREITPGRVQRSMGG